MNTALLAHKAHLQCQNEMNATKALAAVISISDNCSQSFEQLVLDILATTSPTERLQLIAQQAPELLEDEHWEQLSVSYQEMDTCPDSY